MLTEHRVWLTVTSPKPLPIETWEDLLDRLAHSPGSRGPVMQVRQKSSSAGFTVSYPAENAEAAARDSVGYIQDGVSGLGWPGCTIHVDEIQEVDLEAELLELSDR